MSLNIHLALETTKPGGLLSVALKIPPNNTGKKETLNLSLGKPESCVQAK